MSNSKFEIVSRRGEKKPETVEKPLTIIEAPEPKSEGEWEAVTYLVVLMQGQQGPLVIGRAVGLRQDGQCFAADWIFPPVWKAGTNWESKASERLDTFLDCSCSDAAPCGVHQLYLKQWLDADAQRLNLIASAPIPKALEAFIKAEQKRASAKIIVPR